MGDPNGVGPEIVLKALKELRDGKDGWGEEIYPVLYASKEVMQRAEELVGYVEGYDIEDVAGFDVTDLKPGEVDAKAGEASLKCIRAAVTDALKGKIDAVVTAPISKEAISLAGSPYPGHTEMIRDLTNSPYAIMLFDGPLFKVVLVTIHVSLSEVPSLITKERVLRTVEICEKDMREKFAIDSPRIAVCGLNPHAGEGGAFGDEEIKSILPAIREARSKGINIEGPFPADTLFYKLFENRCWDVVVAMYHDQGLIPFKMLSFDTGVNVTLGIPIIRTSPDHGTAFDIAWRGKANPRSMLESIKLATRLSRNKKSRAKL